MVSIARNEQPGNYIGPPAPVQGIFLPGAAAGRMLDRRSRYGYPHPLCGNVRGRAARGGRWHLKLEDITTEMVKKAVEIYVAAAYEGSPVPLTVKSRLVLFTGYSGDDLNRMLSHEVMEREMSETHPKTVTCYTVRLGNPKYPHMKLALCREESDDFRFVVDAHDQHFELEGSDDALKAHELQQYNQRLKREIESRWRDADLPTAAES
jgi:hypothetical protein